MRRFRITDQVAESLLAGRKGSEQGEQDLAELLEGIRDAATRGITPGAAERHLTSITEAARVHAHDEPLTVRTQATSTATSTRRRSLMERSKAFALKLSGSVVALSMATFGLAHAGVDLPGQAAERAFEAVGVELPNQAGSEEEVETTDTETTETNGKSVAAAVREVIETSELRGCEFGQAVAAAASQNRQNEGEAKESPCTRGEGDDTDDTEAGAQGSKSTGEEKSSKGLSTADEAKTKSESAPSGSKATGEEKSESAPSGSKATGEEKSEGRP